MSQKSRKSRPRPSRPAARPVAESPRSRPTLRDVDVREDLAAAAEREGSPAIPVSALIVTTLLVGAYLHLLVLQQMTQLSGGLAMPDSLLFYGQDHIRALSAVMDEDARGQLNWVHKTAGVIFPIAVALTVTAVGAWRLRPAGAKWVVFGLGVLFAVVDICENIAIEQAIAAGGPGTGLAAALTLTRWVLLALLALAVAVMLWAGRRRRRGPAAREA
ncbi:hypothetical protein [Micrococcus luteus]|uniref:hypothetical protein n=1 Tax=Micrococcus luteus TaxID=1270 RepID=UPI0010096169|nr:hypothetical protein [Micrococcus luteus]MCV7527448.1 hypothetical protein [Micrococcus luteus]QAV28280.1 hypothetical protein MT1254_02175 [Micrococcus luteus]